MEGREGLGTWTGLGAGGMYGGYSSYQWSGGSAGHMDVMECEWHMGETTLTGGGEIGLRT